MVINGARNWFDRHENSISRLVDATAVGSTMHKGLVHEGYPETEMKELHETLKKAEELLLLLKQSVIMDLESK